MTANRIFIIIFKYLLRARCHLNLQVNELNPHTEVTREILLLILTSHEEMAANRLKNLTKMGEVITGRALIQTQAVKLRALLPHDTNLNLKLWNLRTQLGRLDNRQYKAPFFIGKSFLNSEKSW